MEEAATFSDTDPISSNSLALTRAHLNLGEFEFRILRTIHIAGVWITDEAVFGDVISYPLLQVVFSCLMECCRRYDYAIIESVRKTVTEYQSKSKYLPS